ncbi:Rieske Fe-S protein [Nocardioides thalensis]|uniref:Rieske Fe-S protein n=1 Tax=Nocardioides thalensis TaxID=1914755 RepID=A0A853C2K8_9ACTN|nr:Rieske (2Fe-2S) protein [Nocardioides thalensis]NYJ01246.1 Rieske Fe-S protein [Nocardioides thalensis]
MTAPVSRRIVFQGLGALGVAAALAGCGGSDDPDTDAGTGGADPQSSGGTTDEPTSGGGSGTGGAGGGTELATTDEVPVGGGLILGDEKIVITQPTEGDFKAFTAVCTHQGLTVTSVEDGTIHCANHGSAFSAETGDVENPPAAAPLAEVQITVEGDRILLAA